MLACLFGACATNHEARSVEAAADTLVGCRDLVGGRVGIVVVDAATGAVLADHSGDRGFAPASNQKIVSSAVALLTLEPDHRWPTELLVRGDVRDGVLHGDLVLRGFGDPTLGKRGPGNTSVADLVAGVQALGIRRVAGCVVGDGSWQGNETLGLGWQWDYLDEDYAAPFGGLNFAGNVATVNVAVSPGGVVVEASPKGVLQPVAQVAVEPAGATTRLSAGRALGSDSIVVRGAIAADARAQSIQVAVREPAAFAAAALSAMLRDVGVSVDGGCSVMAAADGPATSAVPASAVPTNGAPASGVPERLIARVESAELSAVLRPLLTNSDNLYAEQLWRVSARMATGQGTTAAAARHAATVLASIGVDVQGMVLADGSGLSRRNLVQPRQLARILRAIYDSPHRRVLFDALPVAGESGTLRTRFAAGAARGHVRAKTGYISRVVCLSGYVSRPDPAAAPLIFSVMLNDFTCDDAKAKAAVDDFVQRLATAVGW